MPELPPEYFTSPLRWWNQEGHSGHDLFDLLTPALADLALRTSVAGPLCQVAGKLLGSAAADLTRSVGGNTFKDGAAKG